MACVSTRRVRSGSLAMELERLFVLTQKLVCLLSVPWLIVFAPISSLSMPSKDFEGNLQFRSVQFSVDEL